MTQAVNLLEPRLRRGRDFLSLQVLAIAAGVTLLVVLLGAGYATMKLDGANKRQQVLNAQMTQLQQQMAALAQALGERKVDPHLVAELQGARLLLTARKEVLQVLESGAIGNMQGFSGVFQGFSRQTTEGVWLTGFSIDSTGIAEIRGRMIDASLLPGFVRRLNAEPEFKGRQFAALDMRGIEAKISEVSKVSEVSAVAAPASAKSPVESPSSVPASAALPGNKSAPAEPRKIPAFVEFSLHASEPVTVAGDKR